MGYRCNSRPNILIVSYWGHSRAAAEPWQWKKNLRVAFGLEKYSSGAKLAYGRDTEFKLGEDPSKIPLPKTPETMKREVFRATEVADADLEEEGFDRRPSIRYASESEWSDDDQSSGNDSAYASDYKDAGFVSNKGMKTGRRENSARDRNDSSQDRNNSASQPSRPYDRRDQSNR
ncbi:hypothetical protein PC119_g23040 [Phytophthora cactorum]|nr:hypothetical protein PC111_g20727 [Phytophthora cactorum]KAG2972877.1 hypothetical protein PC119_g23040 [Phytophthora cactorum]